MILEECGRLHSQAFTRRDLVAALLASGLAAGLSRPVSATITTDTRGLSAGGVKIPVAKLTIPGYRAMPARGGPFSCLIVIHETYGLSEHVKDLCRRLAKAGYFAIAPNLFAREGDPRESLEKLRAVQASVPDDQVMSDLDATATWAKHTGKADVSRLGVVGFGWGGRIAWLYAAHDPAPRASVAWYGHFKRPATPQEPRHPLDVVSELKAPVLGLYGAADGGIPVGDVDTMRAALEAAGKDAQIVVYPDAHHAFNADDRPNNYQPEAAQAAWQRMLGWLNEHGVTSQVFPAVAGTANAAGTSASRRLAHLGPLPPQAAGSVRRLAAS